MTAAAKSKSKSKNEPRRSQPSPQPSSSSSSPPAKQPKPIPSTTDDYDDSGREEESVEVIATATTCSNGLGHPNASVPLSSLSGIELTPSRRPPSSSSRRPPSSSCRLSNTVHIQAPADLVEGYEFVVELPPGRQPALVRVPAGGVTKGQTFPAQIVQPADTQQQSSQASSSQAPLPSSSQAPPSSSSTRPNHRIPHGRWRSSVWHFCPEGMCHPMCCLAYWFTPVALGQIMTRMHLDWLGRPLTEPKKHQNIGRTFCICSVINLIVTGAAIGITVLLGMFVGFSVHTTTTTTTTTTTAHTTPAWAKLVNEAQYVIFAAFYVLLLGIVMRTRTHMRRRYGIAEIYCHGCEDCCCSFCNPWCAVLQMASHTADYQTYPATWCTRTGLSQQASECSECV